MGDFKKDEGVRMQKFLANSFPFARKAEFYLSFVCESKRFCGQAQILVAQKWKVHVVFFWKGSKKALLLCRRVK